MKIEPLPELKEIGLIQARTKATRAEGKAIIAATSERLATLKADLGISSTYPSSAPSDITWLPFAAVAALAAGVGLWAGFVLSGGLG